MAMDHRGMSGILSDYATLKSVPALLSAVFIIAGAFTFGAISALEVVWFGGYSLGAEHATLISAAVLLVAFMSSDTRRFEDYETIEKVLIGTTVLIVVGWEYITEVRNLLMELGDPLGAQVAFAVTLIGWIVAVR